ncbi:uncharacterized protein [Penaeus vannamei]|uniref:uncharacterized protein n=1 Tax=Penaeus vannamei TaxID=6689 RepID=UPI00387F8B0C
MVQKIISFSAISSLTHLQTQLFTAQLLLRRVRILEQIENSSEGRRQHCIQKGGGGHVCREERSDREFKPLNEDPAIREHKDVATLGSTSSSASSSERNESKEDTIAEPSGEEIIPEKMDENKRLLFSSQQIWTGTRCQAEQQSRWLVKHIQTTDFQGAETTESVTTPSKTSDSNSNATTPSKTSDSNSNATTPSKTSDSNSKTDVNAPGGSSCSFYS